MPTQHYQNELAQNLRHQLYALEQHASVLPKTIARVTASLEHFLGTSSFAGWLRLLSNGQVLLLTSSYAPESKNWAFYLHLVSSEGHYGTGHFLAILTDYHGPKKLFIGDFKIADDYQNAGTGSWIMIRILDFCRVAQVDLIEGAIVERDWDQVEMLTHFYTKHGFSVTPGEQPKSKVLEKILHKPASYSESY